MAQSQPPLKIAQTMRVDGKIKLDVTVPASLLGQVRMRAAFSLGAQSRLDLGEVFNEGDEAVMNAVIKTVGDTMFEAFLNQYVMSSFAFLAVSQQELEIVMEPETTSDEQLVEGKDFHFTVVVTPKPRYEVSSYDPVTVKIPKPEVSEAEIDRQFSFLAESYATYIEDKEGEVTQASEVAFAIDTKDEAGEPISALTAVRRVYKLGEGYLPASFDENLIGLKLGDTKTFEFELPEFLPGMPEGSEKLTGNATTTIKMKKIKKRVVPAITDAWVAKNIPDAKTVEGLREMARAEGNEYKAQGLESVKIFSVASEFAKRLEGLISDELYEYTARDLTKDLQERLKQQGISFEAFLAQQGMDKQSFSMQIMLQAREILRQGFALDALARHLELTLTPEDIEETLEKIAPGDIEGARAQFSGGRGHMLTDAALRSKANKWLYDTATFEYIG